MSTQRVVIGKYNNGVDFGLRVSLPGIDALTGDSSGGDFSFDSNWTDIVQTILVSTAVATSSGTLTIPYTNTGYIPYGEFRYVSGNTVYDDYFGSLRANGVGAALTSTSAALSNIPASSTCLFAVFKVPVMSG